MCKYADKGSWKNEMYLDICQNTWWSYAVKWRFRAWTPPGLHSNRIWSLCLQPFIPGFLPCYFQTVVDYLQTGFLEEECGWAPEELLGLQLEETLWLLFRLKLLCEGLPSFCMQDSLITDSCSHRKGSDKTQGPPRKSLQPQKSSLHPQPG